MSNPGRPPVNDDALYTTIDRVTDDHGHATECFAASHHVGSPWGPLQHGGPVAGLLTRAMELHDPRPGTRLTRITMNILGAVPMSDLRVSALTLRPGRRIELVSGLLEAADAQGRWRPVARSEGWRLATQPTMDVVHEAGAPMPFPETDTDGVGMLPAAWSTDGFVAALDWRGVTPGWGEPTRAWLRLPRPLVAGEEASPLVQAVALADVANGLGARLDPSVFSFLNTDLTVHLQVPPQGPWFGLAAQTAVGPDGVALSHAVLHEPQGPVGRITQNVLVERRLPG